MLRTFEGQNLLKKGTLALFMVLRVVDMAPNPKSVGCGFRVQGLWKFLGTLGGTPNRDP